jgi:hypothetical protein
MRYERTPDMTCPACIESAALKQNGAALQRRISESQASAHPAEMSPVDSSSNQESAAAWLLAIDVCLRRDSAQHPSCAACGILLGAGHIETGIDGYCGTCHSTRRNATEAPATRRTMGTSVYGVRGWLRDQSRRH